MLSTLKVSCVHSYFVTSLEFVEISLNSIPYHACLRFTSFHHGHHTEPVARISIDISAAISTSDVCSRPVQGTTSAPAFTPTLTLTASPAMRPPSRAQLCYRTLPSTRTDARLRPDLRLGQSDAAVRRVGALVRWFEGVSGIGGS